MTEETVHFYNLAHFKPFSPILAVHAVRADIRACENALNYPSNYRHCPNCGVMSVCGLSSFYSIKFARNSRGKAPRSRTLHILCLCCGHVDVKKVLVNKKEVASIKTDHARRRKRSELSALLEKRKEQEKVKRPSLDLMTFMQ